MNMCIFHRESKILITQGQIYMFLHEFNRFSCLETFKVRVTFVVAKIKSYFLKLLPQILKLICLCINIVFRFYLKEEEKL